jgi:hypothetical protein
VKADFAGPIAENELTNEFCVGLMRRTLTAQINAYGTVEVMRETGNTVGAILGKSSMCFAHLRFITASALGESAMVFAREKAALYADGSGQTKNAGWNLDSHLEIKHDPCWGMVARVFLPTRPSVNTAIHEPDRQIQ